MEIQWALVLFTALSGAGAWVFAFIGLNEFTQRAKSKTGLMVACAVAVILLAAGGVASTTHLSHVDHMLWVLQHPAEGIFMEALLIAIDAILAIIYFLLIRRDVTGIARKIIAVLAIAMGFYFTYSCGSSYMMSSQLTWDNYALPLGYMGTAIPSGAAIWLLITRLFKEDESTYKLGGITLLCAGVLSLIFSLIYGFVSGAVTGDQALLFWLVIVVCGAIIPICGGIVVAFMPKLKRRVLPTSIVCIAAGFAGSIGYRVLMWTMSVALMSLFGEII